MGMEEERERRGCHGRRLKERELESGMDKEHWSLAFLLLYQGISFFSRIESSLYLLFCH